MHDLPAKRRTLRRSTKLLILSAMMGSFGTLGCNDLLNPSFIDLFAVDGSAGGFSAVQLPIGHVPILFKNEARFADDVFFFVIQKDSVVREEVVDEIIRENPTTDRDEIRDMIQNVIDNDASTDLAMFLLPPRVRLLVDVTYVDGSVQRLEFLSGLRIFRDETDLTAQDQLPPDLQENTNNTFIVQCEVARIAIADIQVFRPVVVRNVREIIDAFGFVIGFDCFVYQPLQFDSLEPDQQFDTNLGAFSLIRNYDPRFFPPPLENLQCGAVISIELSGQLSFPFIGDVPNACLPTNNPPENGEVPGFLTRDTQSAVTVPGRFAVRMVVRG